MRAGGIVLVLLALGCGESKGGQPGAAGAAPTAEGGAGGRGGQGTGGVAASAGASGGPGACASIEFADPKVDAAVRAALVNSPPAGPLSPADVAPLVKLNVTGAADLGGVECLSGLVELDLYSPAGASLLPLSALPLKILAAFDGSITQPEALAAVATLEQLTLDGVGVVDISFTSGLAALKTLSVTGSPLVSLTPLGKFTGLQSIVFQDTSVADLTPLGALPNLSTVNFSGSQVSELHGVPAPSSDVELACFYAHDLPLSPHALSTGIPALCDLGWAVSWSTSDGSVTGSCNGSCDK